MSVDPFGTDELRAAVLDAWARQPTRLREDSNSEEDHATGYYRDRVVVELAQNAADAAARAGVPGTLLLQLVEREGGATLVAANTGVPLDARGVAALATLRASAKTGGEAAVGRFGVGFAAVRSVSDDIVVRTAAGGVQLSVDRTRDALAGLGEGPRSAELAALVAARGGSLPALRLPFAVGSGTTVVSATSDPLGAVAASALETYATVVELHLRDDAAVAEVRRQLDEVDDALLLALPALRTIDVQHHRDAVDGRLGAAGAAGVGDRRLLTDVASRWVTATATGAVPELLLADRPVEERGRSTWTITWAVRRGDVAPGPGQPVPGGAAPGSADDERLAPGPAGTGQPGVVRAPTPTDEPLTVPAVLVASFPLDPSRRHVAEGPLTDFVADRSGEVLAELAARVDDPLALVPTGLAAGRVDSLVRDSVLTALREAPLFDGRRARDVSALARGAGDALLAALVPTGLGVRDVPPARLAAARALDMPVLTVPDVVDALPAGLTPPQWCAVYDALVPLADTDRAVREVLDGIFVPLVDGTTARGARGLLLSRPGATLTDLGAVDGLRLVHPEAAHPLLLRLGAVDARDLSVLGLAAVEDAVHEAARLLLGDGVDVESPLDDRGPLDAGDPLAGRGPVPGLLALLCGVIDEHKVDPADLPTWWGDLPLPGAEGGWSRAGELAWPGSWAAEHLDLDVVDTHRLDRLVTRPDEQPGSRAGSDRLGGGAGSGRPGEVRSGEVRSGRPGGVGSGEDEEPARAGRGARAALACGVRTTLVVRTVELDTGDSDDVVGGRLDDALDGLGVPDDVPDVSGWADYDAYLCAVLGRGVHLTELPVLLDLDVVHDESWGEVARLAVRDPEVRRAVVGRVGPVVAGGPTALTYAAWYLRDVLAGPFVVTGGRGDRVDRGDQDCLGDLGDLGGRGGLDADLVVVLPTAPGDLDGVEDAEVLRALGGLSSVGDLDRLLAQPDPLVWDGVAAALERPEVPEGTVVPLSVARAFWSGLGRAALAGLDLDVLPGVVVAVRAGACRTVDASTVVVTVEPMWAQVRAVVPAVDHETAEAVAELLDVPVADAARAVVQTPDDPAERTVPAPVRALLPGLPDRWLEHAGLAVDGQEVDWWVTSDGGVHVRAGAPVAVVAQALAQAGGLWSERYLVEVLLADPARARDADLERSWEH